MNFLKITPHLLLSIGFVLSNCSKENTENLLPIVTTAEITSITQISALCGGTIISDEGSIIKERGVCWDTILNPTVESNKTSDGLGAGSFLSLIFGLEPNKTYYVKTYATNSKGTGYGSTMSLTTNPYGKVTDVEGNQYKTLNLGLGVLE